MNNKMNKAFMVFLITGLSSSLFACNKKAGETVIKNHYINFHIGEEITKVNEENSAFKVIDTNLEHHRFIGWSTTTNKKNIIINNDTDIKFDDVSQYFAHQEQLDLYAIYAELLTVHFVLEEITTFTLDSDLQNKEKIPEHHQDGMTFNGWSINQDKSTIDLANLTYVSYADVSSLNPGNYDISFYPVYSASILTLYEYNTADEMAEIHIETENHLAIDDKSLIIPDEHKGKDGELAVYDYVKATISVDHCEDQYVLNSASGKVKVRGNYTSSYPKRPIRIKFDSKQKMLGLNHDNKMKSWVLLAGWKDTSLLRDASAFYLGNALLESDGYYTSDFRLVKVYLNGAYNGVYLLVEQQQINEYRLNIPESSKATDSYKTGYLLEFDGYYQNEKDNQKFTISYNDIKINKEVGFTISNDIMNNEQFNFVKKATQNIWKVLYDACKNNHSDLNKKPYHTIDENGDYIEDKALTSAKTAIDRVIDTNSLANMYLLHDILEDRDIGFSSFYFTLDFSDNGNKKLTFNAPWDFDYAIGNNTFENAMRARLNVSKLTSDGRMTGSFNNRKLKADAAISKDDLTFSNQSALYCQATDNPWFEVVSKEPWLWNMLYERYNMAKEAGLFTSLLTMVETLSNKYVSDFKENYEKWPNCLGIKLSAYQPDEITYFVTQKQAADYLRFWLEERINGLGSALKSKSEQK